MKQWLIVVAAICAPVLTARAATIGFGSPEYSASTGQISLEVLASGLPAGTSIGAFDLTFHFDPSHLQFEDFVFGTHLGDPAAFEVLNSTSQPGAGSAEIISVSLLSVAELQALQQSGFGLGILVFGTLGPGSSNVTISGIVSDALGQPYDISFSGASVIVGIPEPGTAQVMLLGLVAIAPLAFRRRAKPTFH
jgi:hypothetical protein